MHPRKEKQQTNFHLRAPRVPSVPSVIDLFSKALTKEIFLFDQGFFFVQIYKGNGIDFSQSLSIPNLIFRFQTKLISLWKLIFQPKFIFQFYISYLTPAS